MDREEAIAMMQVYKEELAQRVDNIKYDLELRSIYLAQINAFDMAIEALHHVEAEEKGYCHRIIPSNIEVVVRCKDCEYRKKNKFCLEHNRYEKDDNGYCSRGERKQP